MWPSTLSTNRILNTTIKGFLDISGGDVIIRNGNIDQSQSTGWFKTGTGNVVLGTVGTTNPTYVNCVNESDNILTGSTIISGGVGIFANTNIGGNLRVNSKVESFDKTNGAVVISGGLGVFANTNIGGNITVKSTVESNDILTGSTIISGGVGIFANTNIGGNLRVNSKVESNSFSTGALVVSGGTGISGNVYVGGNLNVSKTGNFSGNLNITGFGTTNMLQYSNGQLYFTNNYTTTASSANANSGFNFRNYYNSGGGNTYQNFLLINDKTDSNNYYNKSELPIWANNNVNVYGGSNPRINLFNNNASAVRFFVSGTSNSLDIGSDTNASGTSLNFTVDGTTAQMQISASQITGNKPIVVGSSTAAALRVYDNTDDSGSTYGTVNITRTDNLNRSHLALIRSGNAIWEFGYVYDTAYTNHLGIFQGGTGTANNFNPSASSQNNPAICFQSGGGVAIGKKSVSYGYALDVSGNINASSINASSINAGTGNVAGVIIPLNSGGSISGATGNTIIYTSPANHNFVIGSTEIFRITTAGIGSGDNNFNISTGTGTISSAGISIGHYGGTVTQASYNGRNGLYKGTGDANTYNCNNVALCSWYSVGFYDTYGDKCGVVIDCRNANLNLLGGINLGYSYINSNTLYSNTIKGVDDIVTTNNNTTFYAKNLVIQASNLSAGGGWYQNANQGQGYAGSLYLNAGGYTESTNNGTAGERMNGGHVYIQGGYSYASDVFYGPNMTCIPGNIYFNSGKMNSGTTYYNSYTTYMMVQGTTGRVGIGTTSPSYTLDVNGSTRSSGNFICNGSGSFSATGNNFALSISDSTSGSNNTVNFCSNVSTVGAYVPNTSIGDSLIFSSGAAISSTSTALVLGVWSSSSNGIRITYNSTILNGSCYAPTVSTSDSSTQIATTAFVKNQAYATLASPTFTGTVTAPTVSTSDSSTQIATTAFVKNQGYAKLANTPDFTDGARIRNKLYIGVNDPGGGGSDTAYLEYVAISGEETTLRIVTTNDNTDHINLNPSGNVGIKKDSPGYTLDVNGNVNATSYNATSDYRIKEDIKPITSNIDVLKPVCYYNRQNKKDDMGFIAHEVQEHFPFLVTGEKDGKDIQSLNYIGFIALLTKEVQDLKKDKINKTEEIENLKKENQDLKFRLDHIESLLTNLISS